jgi:hypothetical protein
MEQHLANKCQPCKDLSDSSLADSRIKGLLTTINHLVDGLHLGKIPKCPGTSIFDILRTRHKVAGTASFPIALKMARSTMGLTLRLMLHREFSTPISAL